MDALTPREITLAAANRLFQARIRVYVLHSRGTPSDGAKDDALAAWQNWLQSSHRWNLHKFACRANLSHYLRDALLEAAKEVVVSGDGSEAEIQHYVNDGLHRIRTWVYSEGAFPKGCHATR